MNAPIKSRTVKPLFGGLTCAKVRYIRYELGGRLGPIFIRLLYWTRYSWVDGWSASLYDNNGYLLIEANGFETEALALEDAIHRFVRLRDAPYLFMSDLLSHLTYEQEEEPSFDVCRLWTDTYQKKVSARRRIRRCREQSDVDERRLAMRVSQINTSPLVRMSTSDLIGIHSELRVIDLFNRPTWSIGERPAWFHSIGLSSNYHDVYHGIDLWVRCVDNAALIPIQVKSSQKGALNARSKSVPIIVASKGYTDHLIHKQFIHECELYRLHRLDHAS